jgi:hypothetical protein
MTEQRIALLLLGRQGHPHLQSMHRHFLLADIVGNALGMDDAAS